MRVCVNVCVCVCVVCVCVSARVCVCVREVGRGLRGSGKFLYYRP